LQHSHALAVLRDAAACKLCYAPFPAATTTLENPTVMIGALTRSTARLYQWPSMLLTLAAIFWAGNTVAGRLAVDQISPFMLTFLRWVVVMAVLWPIYGGQVREHWPQIRPRLPGIVVLASLGFTGFNALYYVAAHYTTAINIGILQGSLPIFVLAGAFIAHGTRATLVQLAGVLVTAVGVVVVATRGEPLAILEVELNKGDLAMLAACALYAFYTVALHDRPDMPGTAFFTLLALIATVTSLPLVAFEALTSGFQVPTTNGLLITAWVAIFPSFLSQIFYLRGVDLIGPGRAGVFINLVPVFSAALAVWLISEPFAAYHAVALALVIGGIWLAQRTRAPQ
jgi:drug/metabolite transporter (DMT)-like permease